MSASEETNVKIGADTGALNSGMQEAAVTTEVNALKMSAAIEKMALDSSAAVKGMQEQISASFNGIGATIGKVTSIFGAMTAVLAGGAVFGHIIGETTKWTGEVNALSKGLGISTQEASGLALALEHIGASSESYVQSAQKLNRQINKNESDLNKMGLTTRDASGDMLDQQTLMLNAIDTLKTYEAGYSRNSAAQKLFGRGVGDVNALMKLNADIIEHAKKRAEELNLVVGPEGVAQTRAYKESMNDMKAVMKSVEIQIGNALMPVMVTLGSWFSAIGPQAIEIFKGALNGVITFIMYLGLGVTTVYETVKAGVMQMVAYAVAGAKALERVIHGDLAGAQAALKDGWKEGGDIGEAAFTKIAKSADKTNDAVAKLWGLKKSDIGPAPEEPQKKKFDPSEYKEKKDTSRVADWKAELEEKKLAEDAFLSSSAKDNLAYWETIKKTQKLSASESKAVNHEILVAKKEIQKEEVQADLDNIKLRMDREKAGSSGRMAIQDEAVKKIAAAYGTDSKEYAHAIAEKEKLAREHALFLIHVNDSVTSKNREIAKIGLDIERDTLAHKRSMGMISVEEELREEISLENRKAAINRAALQEKLEREKTGTLEHQKYLNQIEIEELNHAKRISAINKQQVKEQTKMWETMYGAITHSMTTSIHKMIDGTMKFRDAMKKIASTILHTFVDMGLKMLFDWVKKQLMMTVATETESATRTAITSSAETTSTAVTTTGAMTKITANAATAASGAASSQAGIPYVGPIMAAVAAAAMLAMVLGFGSKIGSAAGGWGQIPEDQVAQLHKDEMVLPAEIAEGVRNNIGSGKQQQQGGDTHMHIHATDAKSVKRLFRNNGDALAKSLARQSRNGAIKI